MLDRPNHSSSRLAFDQGEIAYDFGPEHPLNPRRLVALMDLLKTSGLWEPDDKHYQLPIRAATVEELSLIHTEEYISAVQLLSIPERIAALVNETETTQTRMQELAEKYGFGEGDTPPIPGMHDISALISGGTLVALSAVMGLPEGGTFEAENERPLHVFHPAGGLHHAWADRASGFCIYNDVAVAIAQLLLPSTVRKAFPSTQRLSPMAGIFDLLHLRGNQTPSRSRTIESPAGSLLLRDFCPPSLVERLVPDSGLHAFARIPEREHQLLLNLAKSSDCALTVAHAPSGVIVGQVTLAPGDDWWDGFENVYEVTIEVSSNWRNMGIAHQLLSFALELDALEAMILFAMGLSWHWDTDDLHMTSDEAYRQAVCQTFAQAQQGVRLSQALHSSRD
jgi:Histone deacetylase domain